MKSTVFIDQKGKVKDYVETIRTKSTTGDKAIQQLQTQLNLTIKQYQQQPATAVNLKKLWNTLQQIIDTSNVYHTEYEKYIEIMEIVEEIGNKIAYFNAKRKGWNGNNIKALTGECSDQEKIEIAKQEILRGLINGEVNEKGLKKIEQYTDADYLQVANNAIEEERKSREQEYNFFVKVG